MLLAALAKPAAAAVAKSAAAAAIATAATDPAAATTATSLALAACAAAHTVPVGMQRARRQWRVRREGRLQHDELPVGRGRLRRCPRGGARLLNQGRGRR